MFKIFITCRNRLSITTKCISAIRKFSTIKPQIYVFDNLTNYMIQEHFMYFSVLYEKEIISQYTVNTKESTFNAFSKAVACNNFLFNHEQDPNKDKYDFLLFLDNDIIVTPQFDQILSNAWSDVKKYKMDNIKIIGQLPGGIISKKEIVEKIGGFKANTGKAGGSGFWSVRTNFAREIGYLDIPQLVGHNKKHDQNYWVKLEQATKGKDYILGLDHKLCIHTGSIAGSICNTLTRNKNSRQRDPEEIIKFVDAEEKINSMSFDEFYKSIFNNNQMINNW
jgi:hypothetical protein